MAHIPENPLKVSLEANKLVSPRVSKKLNSDWMACQLVPPFLARKWKIWLVVVAVGNFDAFLLVNIKVSKIRRDSLTLSGCFSLLASQFGKKFVLNDLLAKWTPTVWSWSCSCYKRRSKDGSGREFLVNPVLWVQQSFVSGLLKPVNHSFIKVLGHQTFVMNMNDFFKVKTNFNCKYCMSWCCGEKLLR